MEFENKTKISKFNFKLEKEVKETCIYLENFEAHGFEIAEDYRGVKFAYKDGICLKLLKSPFQKGESFTTIHVCIGDDIEINVKLEDYDTYENLTDKLVETLGSEVEGSKRILKEKETALESAKGMQKETYED